MRTVISSFLVLLLVFLGVCINAPVFAVEGNLLRNADFSEHHFLCGFLNWGVRNPARDRITFLKGEGPDGQNAVRLEIQSGKIFDQPGLKLIPGEKYRFGVWVRTNKIRPKSIRLLIWNSGWHDEVTTVHFPTDTQGKWVKMEWEGTIFKSPDDGLYVFGIYGGRINAPVDISAPYVIPLTEKAKKESLPAKKATIQDLAMRIVPVDPLLRNIDAADPQMTFYYPGEMSKGINAYELTVTIGKKKYPAVNLSAEQKACVKFPGLTSGEHKMTVAIGEKNNGKILAQNQYQIQVVKRPAKQAGTRLNNMVTQIFSKPLKSQDLSFTLSRESWVAILVRGGAADTKVFLDQQNDPVVLSRPGEPLETMRYLPAGTHTLRVSGNMDGTMIVNAVKPIHHSFLTEDERTAIDKFQYGHDFFKRYLFRSFNYISSYYWKKNGGLYPKMNRMLDERGIQAVCEIPLQRPVWSDQGKFQKIILDSPGRKDGFDVAIDEAQIGFDNSILYHSSEALWGLTELQQRVNLYYADLLWQTFSNPKAQGSFLAACINVGRGRSLPLMEAYIAARKDEKSAKEHLDLLNQYVVSTRKLVPSAPSHFIYNICGYISPEVWNDYSFPQCDIKVFFDMFFQKMANDPEFRDAAGVGVCNFYHADEELVRWFGKLFHYYCVEGGTKSLAEQYGFKYNPNHLKNCDFDNGLKDWTVSAAEQGSLVPIKVNGYGKLQQHRKFVDNGVGDNLAMFVRSAKAPNKLTQVATNLVPGKVYSLTYFTTDYDDVLKPKNEHTIFELNALLDGGEIIPELSFRRVYPKGWDGSWGQRKGTVEKVHHRILFRAKKSEVTLTFSDWKNDKEPGAAIGQRRLLNYIILRPYYMESEEELQELIRCFGVKSTKK